MDDGQSAGRGRHTRRPARRDHRDMSHTASARSPPARHRRRRPWHRRPQQRDFCSAREAPRRCQAGRPGSAVHWNKSLTAPSCPDLTMVAATSGDRRFARGGWFAAEPEQYREHGRFTTLETAERGVSDDRVERMAIEHCGNRSLTKAARQRSHRRRRPAAGPPSQNRRPARATCCCSG